MSEEEIQRIAEAVVALQLANCSDCSQEGRDRHSHHHALFDKFLEVLDKFANTRWKIFYVSVSVITALTVGSIFIWILVQLGIDIRKWKP